MRADEFGRWTFAEGRRDLEKSYVAPAVVLKTNAGHRLLFQQPYAKDVTKPCRAPAFHRVTGRRASSFWYISRVALSLAICDALRRRLLAMPYQRPSASTIGATISIRVRRLRECKSSSIAVQRTKA
jgi:hypothetical protein